MLEHRSLGWAFLVSGAVFGVAVYGGCSNNGHPKRLPSERPNAPIVFGVAPGVGGGVGGGAGGTSGGSGGGPANHCECVAAKNLGATGTCSACFNEAVSTGGECVALAN